MIFFLLAAGGGGREEGVDGEDGSCDDGIIVTKIVTASALTTIGAGMKYYTITLVVLRPSVAVPRDGNR